MSCPSEDSGRERRPGKKASNEGSGNFSGKTHQGKATCELDKERDCRDCSLVPKLKILHFSHHFSRGP